MENLGSLINEAVDTVDKISGEEKGFEEQQEVGLAVHIDCFNY